MSKGALLAMTYSVAKDYLPYNIRCNSISPARIHTPFVDGYLKKNYPGKENEFFEKLVPRTANRTHGQTGRGSFPGPLSVLR
jgi:NAD(P)-dependent dehydrogenase (short-subunit alcohol dehydrogenase family)